MKFLGETVALLLRKSVDLAMMCPPVLDRAAHFLKDQVHRVGILVYPASLAPSCPVDISD